MKYMFNLLRKNIYIYILITTLNFPLISSAILQPTAAFMSEFGLDFNQGYKRRRT